MGARIGGHPLAIVSVGMHFPLASLCIVGCQCYMKVGGSGKPDSVEDVELGQGR